MILIVLNAASALLNAYFVLYGTMPWLSLLVVMVSAAVVGSGITLRLTGRALR